MRMRWDELGWDMRCQEGTRDGTEGIRMRQEVLGWNTEHQGGTGGGTGRVKRCQDGT